MNIILCQEEQGCTPQAIAEYDKVSELVNNAKQAGNNGDYKTQKSIAIKAVEISKRIERKYKCYSAIAYWALSDAYSNLGDFDNALRNSQESLNFCEKFKREDCKCKSTSEMKIGNAYSAMGNDSLALIEYKKALEICKYESGQKIMEAYILQATGSLEIRTGNINSAFDKFTQAENIIHEIGDSYEFSQYILGRCLTNKGIILYKRSQCDDALPKLLTGLQISKDVFDNKTIAISNYYIARIYDNKANYDEAISNYKEAINISSKMGDTLLMVDAYNFLGSIYTSKGFNELASETITISFNLSKMNEYKKGMVDAYNIDAWNKQVLFIDSNKTVIDILSQAKSALTMSMDIGYYEGMAEAYNNLETYYENIKDYKMAKKYAKLALKLADSIDYVMVVADAYNDLGDICFKNNNHLDSALYYYTLSIQKSSNGSYNNCGIYKEGIIDSYNKIGNAYLKKNKKDEAYENFYHALEIAKEIMYLEGIDQAQNGIRTLKGLPPVIVKSRNRIGRQKSTQT